MAEGRDDRGWVTGVAIAGCGCVAMLLAGAVAFLFFFGVGVFGGGAAPPTPTDEETARAALDVPPAATLVSITADPMTAGTFGREGLRIVAVFELGPGDLASYRASRATMPGWGPLPLPPELADFRMPPTELPTGTERGLGFCQTGVFVVGTTFTPSPCAPPPPRFDQYRAAVLDEDTGRLTVVLKNYY